AQLEERVARAVAQTHRGERRDEVPLGFTAQIGVLARILEQARGLGVRTTPREDAAECELQRRTLAFGCEIERALEQPAGVAVATRCLEQPGGIEISVRARVVLDRLVDVAELLG